MFTYVASPVSSVEGTHNSCYGQTLARLIRLYLSLDIYGHGR